MRELEETQISQAIIGAYHEELSDRVVSDVIVVGAGPSGMMAAYCLAKSRLKVTLLEKRLSPGGGIWGGGMAMPKAVIQDDVSPLLDELGIRHRPWRGGLHTANAIELAAGLCLKTIQAGAAMFNLMTVEDVCVHRGRVDGVVVNRSMIVDALPVDPITFSARAVIDATGHEASIVEMVRRRGLLPTRPDASRFGEGPMDAAAGETFVVENVGEVFPGLWVSGMSVCATLGGPRMPVLRPGIERANSLAEVAHGGLLALWVPAVPVPRETCVDLTRTGSHSG